MAIFLLKSVKNRSWRMAQLTSVYIVFRLIKCV